MPEDFDSVELATELTIAWLGNPGTRASTAEVSTFLRTMYDSLKALGGPIAKEPSMPAVETAVPAVSVRKSLASKDHIISMIDGKPYKMLRRHLANHGLTPDNYRARFNLKADYPMVAQSYSESRRAMAKQIGLGRKPGQRPAAPASAPAKPKTSRKKLVSAFAESADATN